MEDNNGNDDDNHKYDINDYDEKNIYKNATVVVVDDVEEVLQSTKYYLEFEDMNVKCFSNPFEALEYLKNNVADVLLLDFFMPAMNGDKFIDELRKFNQETVIILQTGYSDKIPPLEMIDKLNIQGYIDKLKGENELILITKAAIKTAFLNKQIREKEKQIAISNYKRALVGDLISHLVNESKDQLFQIAIMNECIKTETQDFGKENEVIQNATGKIYDLYEALNFESSENMTFSQLEKTISELLKAKLLINHVKLSFEACDNITITGDAQILIYLILKVIDDMIKEKTTDINISAEKFSNKISICINGNRNGVNVDIDELKLLTEQDNMEIEVERSVNNVVKIYLNA